MCNHDVLFLISSSCFVREFAELQKIVGLHTLQCHLKCCRLWFDSVCDSCSVRRLAFLVMSYTASPVEAMLLALSEFIRTTASSLFCWTVLPSSSFLLGSVAGFFFFFGWCCALEEKKKKEKKKKEKRKRKKKKRRRGFKGGTSRDGSKQWFFLSEM